MLVMDAQDKPRPLDKNTADAKLKDALEATLEGVPACEVPKDARTAHKITRRQFQGEAVRTSPCKYEDFFKVTLSDGRTVDLLAPNKTTWKEDAAAEEAIKFIEDPAAELEAFLLAFAQAE